MEQRIGCKSQWDVKPPLLTTVSEDKQKRFEELKQRRSLLCGKSTAKRVEHIRQQATEAEFYGPDILQEVGYKTTSPRGKHSRKRRRRQDNKSATSNDEGKEETEWQGLKQFLDPNPQLKGTTQQDNEPKSGLEERLEDAITKGDLSKATEYSDSLADRQFLTKIAGAFDCKQYLDKLKEDERQKKSKKQKLQWRFDIKERWETKSNM